MHATLERFLKMDLDLFQCTESGAVIVRRRSYFFKIVHVTISIAKKCYDLKSIATLSLIICVAGERRV